MTETKSVEATVSAVESENPNGEFDVILSTEALDRDGEKLYIDEWKQPLPDRITFDSDHGMSVATTVGSGVPTIEDGALRVRGTFASTEHAQNVRTLVNEGHITKTSVAFRTIRDNKAATVSRELLNGAFVAVPANEEARVLSSKAVKSDMSHQQSIHDAAVQLGAMCSKSFTDVQPEETSSEDKAGEAGESAEKSAADADTLSAAAADDSADNAALLRARSLAFLITKTTQL